MAPDAAPAAAAGGSFSGAFWPQPANSTSARAAATNAAPDRPDRPADKGLLPAATLPVHLGFMPPILVSDLPAPDPLSDAEYDAATRAILARIEAQADRWLQQGLADIDPQRTGGLLELQFDDDSKIVVNTQPPLQELWLASRRGGWHFRCCGGRWLEAREGGEFFALLSRELSHHAGRELKIGD